MKNPVLFLIFARPDTTAQVFEAIRAARPPKLYVAADGPRAERGEAEAERCRQTRALVVDHIDWPCEVHTLFRDQNLGCGRAVSGALEWFFDHEPQGIILEDDVLPHPDFFPYMEELLERFQDSQEVYFIGGNNFDFYEKKGDESYYFSAYNHVWGWAAWRKTAQIYRFMLEGFTLGQYWRAMRGYNFSFKEQLYWSFVFMQIKMGLIDTWDYPLTFSLQMCGKLSVIPNTALIKNLGFGADATHTTGADKELEERHYAPIMPLTHPTKIERNKLYDQWFVSKRNYWRRLPLSWAKMWVQYMWYNLKKR